MARRNLVPNPSFETDVNGWTSSDGAPARFSGGAGVNYTNGAKWPVSPGETYTGSIFVFPSGATGNKTVEVDLDWHDAADNYMSTSSAQTFCPVSQWTRIQGTGTAPAGAAFLRQSWTKVLGLASGDIVYFD
ncbi:MAG: hypothetical protein L0H64_24015, partial [Pseudonocardia sp.]|nr:hypothetical protein [Pseudonocardia sp.]